MPRKIRQDGISSGRLVTLGAVALALALLTVARTGVAEALAYDPSAAPVGTVVPAYTSGSSIVCSAGQVAIAANTLWTASPAFYAPPRYYISYVKYGVWLWTWNGIGWSYLQVKGDGEHARTSLNQQITFSGLAPGSYTVTLQVEFDDGYFTNVGHSDWKPTAFDFYFPSKNYQGVQYCTI